MGRQAAWRTVQAGGVVAQRPAELSRPHRAALFPAAKFRPTTLPSTLVARPSLHEQLALGSGKWLTVVGSAGAGKSVLLSSWAAARQPEMTSWLSCDEADADPVRFWTGFIEAPRAMAPGFGADAAELLAMDGAVSADVTASIANDAARLPAGSAIVVDDFHAAAAAAGRHMTDLVEQLGHGDIRVGLASRRGLLEQLAELDLRDPFGLACLPQPDLTARQRVGPGVHLHAPGSAGESLFVSGRSSDHDLDGHYEKHGLLHQAR
jgi:ATP/maltotriose-dependent transcriptional regulator MalT